MDIVRKAKSIATSALEGRIDQVRQPRIDHASRVAAYVKAHGGSILQIAAAWLHQVPECTSTTVDDLRQQGMPPEVTSIVEALSHRDGEDTHSHAERIIGTPDAVLVKLGDLQDTARPEWLALMDHATRSRLEEKQAAMGRYLDSMEQNHLKTRMLVVSDMQLYIIRSALINYRNRLYDTILSPSLKGGSGAASARCLGASGQATRVDAVLVQLNSFIGD